MTVETQSGGEPIVKSGPYNGNGVTSVLDYDFQIQDEAELIVTRQNADLTETVLVLTTDYTVSGVGNDAGGSITLVDPATDFVTGTKIVITYDGNFNQSVDYSNQGRIQLALLEDGLDKITMHLRSIKELVDRSVKVDSFGATDIATLQSNLTAVAAISSEITTVAGISGNVTTVAGISSAVSTVAGIAADISTVAGDAADIATVAGDSADIATLAGLTSQITTLAGIASDITALANANGGTLTGIWLFSSTAYLGIPRGTTAQRGSPGAGIAAFRFNTTTGEFEGWNGSAWGDIGGTVSFGAVAEDILPSADSTYDLGSSTFAWAIIFGDSVRAAELAAFDNTSPTALVAQWANRGTLTYNHQTPSITASNNVSSVGDVSAGIFDVNWDNDFADTTYAFYFGSGATGASIDRSQLSMDPDTAIAAGSMRVVHIEATNSRQDADFNCVSALGELA